MDYELMMNGNVKIGQKAPEFEAQTTMGNIKLGDYKGKWVILFSHPGDFTPVCTTEIIALSNANNEFQQRGACLLGLSVDSNSSHLAWVFDIYCRLGVRIPFPIIADRSGAIARKYGMISTEISNTETVRNVYIIDDKGIIRAILVYPMNIGRCIPEILRILDAAQTVDKCGGATPVNWTANGPLLQTMPQTMDEVEERVNQIQQKNNGVSWYLSFKENCNKADNKKK